MPEFLYTSPRTKQVYKWTPDDASYEPSEKAMQDIALKVEQIETDSEQSALGAFGSAVGQGLATMPGTVLQGVGAMVGSTGLEEAGKYSAGQAREAFPIDPMRREDFTTKAGQAVGQAIGQLGLAVGTGGGSIGTGLVLGTAAAMGAASGSERAEQSGLTGARRMGRVYGSALTELASERLFGLGSKTFFKPAAIPTTFGQKGLRFAGTSAGEGVEEIAAGVGNNIVDNVTAAGLDIPTPDIVGMNAFKSYAEQGLLGMVGGTVFAGAQLALGSQAAATPVTRAYATVDGVRMEVTDLSPTQRKDLGIDEATVEYESILPTEDADIASGIQNKNVRDMFTEMKTNADAKSLDDALNLGTASSVLATAMGAGTPAAAVTPAPTQAPIVSTPEEAMTSTGAPTPIGTPTAAAAEITEFPAEGPTNLVDLSNLSFTGTPTQTPTFNATLQGDFTENRVEERIQTNEGGTPTEAGRGDSTVERGQVEQAVAEDETVAPPPAVEPGGEGLLNVITPREGGEKGAAATAAQSLTQGIGGKAKKRPPAAAVKAAEAFKAAAAAAAAPTEIPVPQAPASPQAIVNSIPEITATITGETTGTGSTVPAETISLQSEGGPTGSLPAAVSPMTGVSGGLGAGEPGAPVTPAAAPATPATTPAATPAAAAATPAAAPAAEEALPEEPEAVDPNNYKTGDSKDIFVEPQKKGFFSQFFGEDNPYSPKEKQSDLELRDNFVRKYLVDGRVPTTQGNTDKMYELIDTLRSRQRLEAQREQNIEIDPTYGNYDAVPAVQLAEIYLYASRLNDGGIMLRRLQSIGSLFYYSYGGQGRSAARGLNAISHFVRRINIAKAYDIHRKGQSKNAAKNIGVDENDLADFQGYIDGVIPSAEDLNQGLGNAVVNTGVPGEALVSVDDVVANQLRTQPAPPVTPASEPLVTEADIAPQVAAEAASAAEAANVERAQTESRGLDPDTNTEIGDTIYTANPEPKSPNTPKVTPAQARIIVTQTLGFTPKNIAFEDTDVPNEDGDQYAGKVNKNTKQITINLRNINDSTHLKDVLFEEMDHLVYADPMVQAEIALLAENLPEDIRQEVRQYRPEFQREEATIRFMRRLEQEPNTASLWKKFVDAVRAAIRRLFNGQLTTRDLKMAADRVAARSFQAMAAQTFLAGKSGTSYSLAPESAESQRIDQEYLAAVEAGDMETAQRLVDEAAKAAGYKTDPLWHRTWTKFNKFIPGGPDAEVSSWLSKEGTQRTQIGPSGRVVFMSFNKEETPSFHNQKQTGERFIKAYANIRNPLVVDDDTRDFAIDVYAEGFKEFPLLVTEEARKSLVDNGHDAVLLYYKGRTTADGKADEVILLNPNQIKSADPVTYDDAGNIIPPSKRFQKTSDDIRYSLAPKSPEARIDQEYKVSAERGNAAVIASGHELTREVYDELKSKFKPKPRDVFYVADTEVIRNPSDSDRRRMSAEVRSEFGRDSSGDPATRFTKDNFNNTWIWKAHQGMHFKIEPGITSREGVEVNQSNSVPDHVELVQNALRANKPVPLKVQEQYPRYAEFFAKLPPYETSQKTSDDIRYSLPDPNQPAPEAPDLGPNIFTEEASALAATSIALQAKIKARPAPNVAKAKADPNIEFTKSFIAAWDRASGKEKADAKPKEKIPAKEVISEFTSLPKKGKGYALTDTGRDAFLTALNQKLVDLGVPSDLAFEATRRAWATYSTKKQKNIDAKALAAAKKDIREQQRLAKKTADQAQAALDKPTNTAKDYLKPAAAPKGPAVQDPVRKALRDAEKIPRIGAAFNSSPEARNAFMTGLSSKLISLGVDQQTAWAAANKAWSTYQTNLADKVTALRKDIENNKMSAILARELKKIPVYQQNDIQYVREYMKNILVFGGLAEDVADAAATLYINKYVDLMKQTKVKAAEKFIESESGAKIKKKIASKPTEYDKLMEAVRLGVTDQSFTAALAFTAPSKFQAFTQADHDRMVALEEEIQDPDTPNLIKVQKVNELMKLADSRMNDINALNVFTGYLVNNTLSGIGTAAIQVFTPFYSMTTRLATDGVRGLLSLDPQRFIASMYAVMDAADTVTAEFKYSFGNDVFRRGQQAELRTLTDLRKVLDNNLKIYQTTTNGLEKTVAASKIALAAPDYVRRLYSAMDTASQSLFINQIKVVGIYDAMKKNGMSLKKFKDMLDAKRTFRDAYTLTLHGQGGYTKDQIRLIAEDAAMNDFGEQVAAAIGQGGAETIADVYKMAELEGPSEIGVAESVDGHVIPFLLDVLDSIKSSGDRAAGQGAGDLAFRLVVGYPTTALKVLNRSLYFFPPTAVARMILNKRYENQADFDPEAPRKYEMLRTESQKQQRFAEFVTGSFATFILMALIMDERDKEDKDRRFAVHNLGPSDRAAKQAWRAAGNVAQSIQWRASETSPWISVSWAKAGLESLAPVLALVGTVYDSRDEIVDEGKMADHALNVAGGVMGVFNRPLSGLNDIGEILSGEKNSISQKSLASYTAFRASGLVPFSSLLKTYNRTQGPRDLSTATSTMMAQIPIAGPSLTEPGLNLFGDPLGATPNELTYKLPILPVQVGLRQQDVPFYEKILSKGQYPPLKLRTTFEKTYGPVTDSVWRQYVEKRGQMVKKLIIDRWTDLDTLSPEIYDKVLGKFAEAADETVIQELKIQRVPKPVIK